MDFMGSASFFGIALTKISDKKNTLRKVVLTCGLGRVHFLVIWLHALSRPSQKWECVLRKAVHITGDRKQRVMGRGQG